MKKYLISIFMLLFSIFTLSSPIIANAEDSENIEPQVNIFYPNDSILDYQDLTGINNVTTNEIFVAYTLSSNIVNIINKNTRESFYNISTFSNNSTQTNFNNIIKIKFVNDTNLIIVDKTTQSTNIICINISNNEINSTLLQTIGESKIIDIYANQEKILIGTINNNKFNLYETPNKETITQFELNNNYNFENSSLTTATLLAITSDTLFVSYLDGDTPHIIKKSYTSENFSTFNMLNDATLMDYYNFNNQEHIIMIAGNNMYLLSTNDFTEETSSITLLKINNIDIFEDTIIASDNTNKTITTYGLKTSDDNQTPILSQDNVLISSKDSSLGRFNDVSDIFIQGNDLYISDTKNNRVQIIKNGECQEISIVGSKPHSTLLDGNQNLYLITNQSSESPKLLKYSHNNYTTPNQEIDLGNISISDADIDNNNVIYMIDYTNNKLLKTSDMTSIQEKLSFSSFITTTESKIEYIKSQNMFVILNENKLYLLDTNLTDYTNHPFPSLALNGYDCTDISADEKGVYLLCNNKIKYVTISNNTMQLSENEFVSNQFLNFDTIEYDIANSRIYAFDRTKQCIVYLNESLSKSTLTFENIHTQEMLSLQNHPLAISIKNNGIIYDQPYHIGTTHLGILKCIGIEEFGDFYRVLYNEENVMKIGFLDKNNANIISYNKTNKIKVITTNLDVSIYKYPTLLKNNNQTIITESIPTDTYIYISKEKFPISIDTKDFYLYESNGKIGFIFSADIVLDDGTHIIYLKTENASINAIGIDSISLYAEDKTTILTTLSNEQRIYVESYDKNSEYTKVIYKDKDLNTIEGYIKTEYITMDELDDSKIVLIILIVISVVILAVIAISYIVYIKKKN